MRSRHRIRVGVFALGAVALAAGLSSVALAGDLGLTPKQQIQKALKLERSAVRNLKAGADTAADKNLKAAQKALKGAATTLGPLSDAGWDAYDAWNHDEDALEEDCRACAIDDVLDGIDHKLDALNIGTAPQIFMVAWGVKDGGGNALFYRGSGLYATLYNANAIGNLEGKTEKTYPVPTANAGLRDLTEGPDGAIWFTEIAADKIGRFAPRTHAFKEYTLPTQNASPYGITEGPDKALWFTEAAGNAIGRFDPSTHQFSEYPIPTANSYPVAIVTGPDRALWFLELEGNKIGRFSPRTHKFHEYTVPTNGAELSGIAAGPGGLWFTELGTGKVGVISTKGVIKEYDTSSSSSSPWQIVEGPDGDMWFTEYYGNAIGVVTPGGTIHEFAASGEPGGIAASKTTLYYEEYSGNTTAVVQLKK